MVLWPFQARSFRSRSIIANYFYEVKNFICFSVSDLQDVKYNEVMKIQNVQFVVFCHADDIVTEYGIDRHDLLGLTNSPFIQQCI